MTALDTRDLRPRAAELKFLLSVEQADAVRRWARHHLAADPHGAGDHGDQYSTTTLYTDTAGYDVAARRGSYARSKYRVRRYGASDLVFLERKLRTSSMLSKRRALIPLVELARLSAADAATAGWPGAWFALRLAARHLQPVCQVRYDRMARVTPTAAGLARLTIDTNVRGQRADDWRFLPPDDIAVLDRPILELKFLVGLPAVFKQLIETFDLEPARISKYRLAAAALGLAPAATIAAEGAA